MQRLRPLFLIGTLLFIALNGRAQVKIGGYPSLSADNPDIHGVIFSKAGNQLSYPEMTLGSTEALALSFDDFDARLKNYSYTYIRCDQNWQPVLQSSFDYIQGFTDMRIRDAKFSSISRTRYVHYAATLPTSESQIKKSGNYLLKVYLDGDTSKLAFERRMLVVAPKVSVAASVVRPSGQSPTGDQQKLNLSISVNRLRLQNPGIRLKWWFCKITVGTMPFMSCNRPLCVARPMNTIVKEICFLQQVRNFGGQILKVFVFRVIG
ncbi:DUF5103 domain-containing protein [Arachidicoccus ginsenosidivorans]|uniref:DUF5103 domain-containing protein n=1 Tax=Arachidicoccus ginsenosidivorans TaxID=496057 RepID=A0A5B8VGE0_9BACT|nr:DUF5103 domain-containing protein [Arachidicoccus ginsenosidivorans]